MSNQARKIVEVEEFTWTQASGRIIAGLAVFIVALALIYFVQFPFRGDPTMLIVSRVLFGLMALVGLGVVGAAVYSGIQARKMPGVGFNCPYCNREIRFEAEPTQSFDCEFCNRTV